MKNVRKWKLFATKITENTSNIPLPLFSPPESINVFNLNSKLSINKGTILKFVPSGLPHHKEQKSHIYFLLSKFQEPFPLYVIRFSKWTTTRKKRSVQNIHFLHTYNMFQRQNEEISLNKKQAKPKNIIYTPSNWIERNHVDRRFFYVFSRLALALAYFEWEKEHTHTHIQIEKGIAEIWIWMRKQIWQENDQFNFLCFVYLFCHSSE